MVGNELEQLLGIIATILLYCAACCIACYRTIMMTVRILLITESCLICPHQGNPTAQVATYLHCEPPNETLAAMESVKRPATCQLKQLRCCLGLFFVVFPSALWSLQLYS